jgi:tetratricopeptide (TPR) repeat protein
MRVIMAVVVLLLLAAPASAQMQEADLRDMIRGAQTDPTPADIINAANASRLLREHASADGYYDEAWDASLGMLNGLISGMLLEELASGRGVNGLQRKFREVQEVINLPPEVVAGHLSNYPSLLSGGEYDEFVLSLSEDADDPDYRCACYLLKAWVHRVAGRGDVARAYFDSAAVQNAATTPSENPDVAANQRAQRARDLARAGHVDEARRVLAEAMAMPVSDAALPTVRRRWAQTYAELGDVENAIEQIEPLLEVPSLVTVHTLETRLTWAGIRDDPAFREMLDRHR